MKSKLIASLAVLALMVLGVLCLSVRAQTTEEGPGPSEQPSAPMEIGQDQSGPQAQPTEAQPGGPSGEASAQSDQGVARMSLIHGDVSTQRGDSGDWSAATLNQPMMSSDKVSTGDDARAELQLDYANILRVGPNSKANIANLTHKDIQIQLSQGIANYTVSKDSQAEPEIDTPNVSVHPAHHDGVFRIEVRPDGDTIVIVRQGEAQIATPQGSAEVRAGEMATVRGDANSAQYKIATAPDRDSWDQWNSDRDHMIQNAQSWHHTNRYYTGTQDLDAYGHWRSVPDYGDVWVPDQGDDWAPYRDGNWVWEPDYGWTWVGSEPWGWAPYHYGRWFWYDNAWAWWPGPVWGWYQPFWAPAYVSFWGWGGGWGFGFGWGGWGGFGWLPIGPCDWFHPWWGGYRGRFGVVNVTNIHVTNINNYGGIRPLHGGNRFSNINNIRNEHIFRGMSTVDAGRFGAGHMRPHAMTHQQLNGARMMAGNLPVVPTRASLSASGRPAAGSTMRNGGSQRFFGTPHNNVARPTFEQQTASLRQTMQQNHVGAIPAGGRFGGAEPVARGTTAGGTMKPSAGTFQGGRGLNNPVTRSAGNPPSTMQNGNRGGFRPFTPPGSGTRSASPGGFGNTTPQRGGAMPSGSSVNRGGFRPFTPPSSGTRSSSEGVGNVAPQRGSATPSGSSVNRGGFRPFTPPSSGTRSSSEGFGNNAPQRGVTPSGPSASRDGFRPFTPPSRSEVAPREPNSSWRGNSGSGSYWNRTAPSSQPRYNAPAYGGSNRGSSRPQLDMRQPIVRPPSYGGSQSRPSYGGNGGYRAPSYGGNGGYRAPSYGGSRGGYSGGGHVSAPSGGGGHYSGGGGGHSSGGGGGHSSGGGSHSSSGRR